MGRWDDNKNDKKWNKRAIKFVDIINKLTPRLLSRLHIKINRKLRKYQLIISFKHWIIALVSIYTFVWGVMPMFIEELLFGVSPLEITQWELVRIAIVFIPLFLVFAVDRDDGDDGDDDDESPKDDGGIPIEIKEQQNIGSVSHEN